MYKIISRMTAVVIFGLASTQIFCMREEQKELAQDHEKPSAARARTKRQRAVNPAILVKRGRKMTDKPAQAHPNSEISNIPADLVLSDADVNDRAKALSPTNANKKNHSGGTLKVAEKRIREEPLEMTRAALLECLEQIGIKGSVDIQDLASLRKTFDQSQDVNYRGVIAYEIGTLYALGRDGAEKNFSQALEWFMKAIETAYKPVRARALTRIYEIYDTGGFGVEKSSANAMEYLRRAACMSEKAALLFAEQFPSESQMPPC